MAATINYTIPVSVGPSPTDLRAATVYIGPDGTTTTQIGDKLLQGTDRVLLVTDINGTPSTFIAQLDVSANTQSYASTLRWLNVTDAVVPSNLGNVTLPTSILAYTTSIVSISASATEEPRPSQGNTSSVGFVPTASRDTSQTSASSSKSATCEVSHRLSTAEGAGIGIGSAVLGGLVTCLVCFILFSRRRHINRTRFDQGHGLGHKKASEGAIDMSEYNPRSPTAMAVPVASAAALIQSQLPQPVDDNELIQEFRSLKTTITGHIQAYYRFEHSMNSGAHRALLAALTNGLRTSEAKVSDLTASAKLRALTVRAALGSVVLQRVFVSQDYPKSFLPKEIVSVYAGLHDSHMNPEMRSLFLSQWRSMTAVLSKSRYEKQTIPQDDGRLEDIRSAVGQANTFLAPCADEKANDQARLRNLEEIMKRGTRVAWLFFSQPSGFAADWSGGRDLLVVFPGLVQITDKEGRPLAHRRALGQTKEVAKV